MEKECMGGREAEGRSGNSDTDQESVTNLGLQSDEPTFSSRAIICVPCLREEVASKQGYVEERCFITKSVMRFERGTNLRPHTHDLPHGKAEANKNSVQHAEEARATDR